MACDDDDTKRGTLFSFYILQITRESIDACKDYFRSDLQKGDWQLMVELKKTFDIL